MEKKEIMKELKDLIEFNFKIKVHFVNDGCYEESPMLVGDTGITGNTNFEDRFDIEFVEYSKEAPFSISLFGEKSKHVFCDCFATVLLFLKKEYDYKTNTIFLDIPENN